MKGISKSERARAFAAKGSSQVSEMLDANCTEMFSVFERDADRWRKENPTVDRSKFKHKISFVLVIRHGDEGGLKVSAGAHGGTGYRIKHAEEEISFQPQLPGT